MGAQGVHMKEVLSWLVRWAPRASTRDFYPALAALDRHRTQFRFSWPIAQQVWHPVVPGRLSHSLFLRR